MPENKASQSRRRTVAGLIMVSAASVLMLVWAVFPTAAFATVTWDGNGVTNGEFNNNDCNQDSTPHIFWVFTGSPGPGLTDVTLTVNGQTFDMDQAGGPNSAWQTTTPFFDLGSITASVDGATESGVLTISHGCPGETTTTTTPGTTTTATTTTPVTTTTETTTTETTTSHTTTSETTTPGTTTSQTTTSETTTPGTTVSGTTVTPPESSTPPQGTTVSGTTVTPGGTAFTGLENVVPLGAIALMLMTGGSGLMWAGSRRRRKGMQDEDE